MIILYLTHYKNPDRGASAPENVFADINISEVRLAGMQVSLFPSVSIKVHALKQSESD